jgi:hypothetical protein
MQTAAARLLILAIVAVLAAPRGKLGAADAPVVVINDFASAASLALVDYDHDNVSLSIGPRAVTEREQVLRYVAKGGDYPAFTLHRPQLPKDWSVHEALSFNVWSASERDIAVRIDDEKSVGYASRYNGGVHAGKGITHVQIPVTAIGKSIDVHRIRALVLFLDHPPAGCTLWFDAVRLGPFESEKVPFIPYAERFDHQPTMEVASPHLPLARNLSGGPLSAFLIGGVTQGREVVELIERIDLAPKVLSWDREWGCNTWGFGDFYGQRGSFLDNALMQRYLASSMQGPERFEVLVMTTPRGWNQFGLAARAAIIERVRDRGEGLVLLMPFTGDRGAPWPDDLRALSALVDGASDVLDDGGNVHAPKDGRLFGKPWAVTGTHAITAGVPLAALPTGDMEVQRYTPAKDAQVLIALSSGEPVLAVRQVGKGRVVTCAARGMSLTPMMNAPDGYANRPPYRYWEAWYDLLARASAWAGGRSLARAGQSAVVTVAGSDADPWYTLRQWKDAAGAVTDWELAFADPDPAFKRFALSAPEAVLPGQPATVTFTAPEGLAGARWTALLGELGDGRWRTLERIDVDPAKGSCALPSGRVRQPIALVRIQAFQGERLAAEGRAEVVVTPPPQWEDYETFTWYGEGLHFLADVEMARMRDFGLSGNTASPGNRDEWRRLFRGGMRLHLVGFANGMHIDDLEGQQRIWRESKDRAALIRKPSFSDPAFAAEQRAHAEKVGAEAAPFAPLSLITSDETSLTSYTTEFDLDEHPANVAAFRSRLTARFGTVTALNQAFGTAFASFAEIGPVTGEEARKSGQFALWNAWREHNDEAWADVFKLYGDGVRAHYPAARLSVSGTQEQAVFNGIDWAMLTPMLGAVAGYGGRYQELQRLCYRGPGLRSTPWVAYGRSGAAVDYQLWSNLLAGGDGTALFWWYSLRDPDLSFCQSGRDYQRVIAELRAGIGMQLMHAERSFSPVAVLWSANSQRASWTRGRFDEFKKTEGEVMQALSTAGFDPLLLSEAQVASGELAKRKVRVLVLPMTLSLGRGAKHGGIAALPGLQALLDDGGMVLATDTPEVDEFLRPEALPAAVAGRLTRFAEVKGALAAALAKAGARPWVGLAPGAGVTAVLHDISGGGGARLLTVLREAVGSHEVVGADGVPYIQRDASAGPETEQLTIDLGALTGMTCIDCRSGTVLAHSGGTVTIAMRAGDGHPLALLPYRIAGFDASATLASGELSIAWTIHASLAAISPHVVHVEVLDGQGVALRHLCRNVLTAGDGHGSLVLPMASEDGASFTVRVRDVLSGRSAEVAKVR